MKITTASMSFLSAALAAGASGHRLLQENGTDSDIPEVWGPTEPIGGGASEFDGTYTSGSDVEAHLVELLETDEQVSVVGSVELGELVCDSLVQAENAAALSFVIHEETLIADQDSYTFTSGDAFDDGVGVHVWTGVVYSPEQAEDELVPRTVSISWGEVCDVETFLLKVTKRNVDGTTTMIKTVPCDAVGLHICLVEVLVEFEEPGDVVIPDEVLLDFDNTTTTATTTTTTSATAPAPAPTGRRMQEGETEVNVMILYSNQALTMLGGVSHEQMRTTILESIAWTNQAFLNSEVSLRFNPVHIGLLPYDETTTDGREALQEFRLNEDVALLRDAAEADLVQMIGDFNDGYCGWGYYFFSEAYGFSLVKPTCLDNYVHTHEYGHNLGCFHNRDSTSVSHEYAHGLRYCDGVAPYRTIMSYNCGSPYGNYFSNPDVTYLDRPTGTLQEDNARAIEDNMGAVSGYRGDVVVPPTPAPQTVPPTTAPPTTAPPTTAPPLTPPTSDYTSIGCYVDDPRDRVLTGESEKGFGEMTTEYCAAFCEGSAYFGTEYSNECFCGPSTDDPTRLGGATCGMPCSGDDEQICGDRNAISLYKYSTYPYVGCYGDDKHDRVLSGESMLNDATMTTEVCAMFCAGSPYFGTEYGRECFCGVDSDDPDELGAATCDFECAGDASETCGGRNAISVYTYGDSGYLGCWGDSKRGRIMHAVTSADDMTNDACKVLCNAYPYYGTQYGIECWCGDDTTDYETYGPSTACDFGCAGDAAQTCGGYDAMDVWEIV